MFLSTIGRHAAWGSSSERFCHAAIGRLMDGDRGHWFSLVHPCVWLGADHTFTPITNTHWEFRRKLLLLLLPAFSSLQVLRRKCAAAQMMSRLFLPPTYRNPPLSLSPSFLAVLFTSRCTLRGYTHRRQIHIFIYIVLFISKYIRAKAVERENQLVCVPQSSTASFLLLSFFLSLSPLSSCGWIVARVPSIWNWASLAGGRWRETVEIEVVLFICCGWPPLTLRLHISSANEMFLYSQTCRPGMCVCWKPK